MNESDIAMFVANALSGTKPRYHRITIDSETHITYRETDKREPTRFWGPHLILEAGNGLTIRNGYDSMTIPSCQATYDSHAHGLATQHGVRIAYQRHAPRLNELVVITIKDGTKINAQSKTYSKS